MNTERTWEIRDWNCETQKFDAPRTVTLAQFKAENAAKSATARKIFADSIRRTI